MPLPSYPVGMSLAPHTLHAHNDAAASANKIHDDAVAMQYGFRGGLVPGVSVYAYMTYPLVQSFGQTWLECGQAYVQLAKPIYEGDAVTVTGTIQAVEDTAIQVALAGSNAAGTACGVGTATVPATRALPPAATVIPLGPPPAPHVPVSWDAVVVGQPLTSLTLTVTQEANEAYCQEHTDDLVLYRGPQGFVHPGILLRQCNRIFSEHFILGPWMHVGSTIATYHACRVGEPLEVRGVPIDKFVKKGHEFTVLDVVLLTAGAVAQRVQHTCIFRPRQGPAPAA